MGFDKVTFSQKKIPGDYVNLAAEEENVCFLVSIFDGTMSTLTDDRKPSLVIPQMCQVTVESSRLSSGVPCAPTASCRLTTKVEDI